MVQPQLRALSVRQVLLAEHLQTWLALNQLRQHRIGTGPRQPGVQHFNDHVNVFDALLNRLAREVHVPRKPLNSHKLKCEPKTPLSNTSPLIGVRSTLINAFQARRAQHDGFDQYFVSV